MSDSSRPASTSQKVRVVAVLSGLLALVAVLGAPGVPAVHTGADVPGAADSTIAWLDGEIADNAGTLPGPVGPATDWGLTADAALARVATGRSSAEETQDLADRMLGGLDEYSTWDGLGEQYEGVRTSGALAKVMLVAVSAGLDISDVGGLDLEAELRSLIQTSGESAGRFSDRNPHGPDNSNGFDQAYAMLVLSVLGDVPAPALGFLLDQQCPGGSFRLVYAGSTGCDDDAESNPDATALAVQVMLVLERTPAIESALADALGRLLGVQREDGSFPGAPPTEEPNANSTGLVAQALRAAGQTEAADAAAAWVGLLQVGTDAAGTAVAAEVGAIAYNPGRRSEAIANGIAAQQRDQWRRASSQGVLALGAGPFVATSDEPPVEPSPTTSTTTTTSTSTTTTSTSITSVPATRPPSELPPSAAAPVTVAGEQASSEGSGEAQLAATGADGAALGSTGAGLVLIGSGAILLSVRMRRPRHESWHWG